MRDATSPPLATPRDRVRAWATTALVVFVAGTAISGFGAKAIADNDRTNAARQLSMTSADIASTLQLTIRREQDLLVSATGFLTNDPTASNAEFRDWANATNVLDRYPELLEVGIAVIVPAAALPGFGARAVLDPAGPLAADGTFAVQPAGSRAFYCLPVATRARSVPVAFPAGSDFCAGQLAAVSLGARDSGLGSNLPIRNGTTSSVAVMSPVYRSGAAPATVAARRAAFLGWIGMSVSPEVILNAALVGHPGIAASMSYLSGSQQVSFARGPAPDGDKPRTTDLAGGWTLRTYDVASGASDLSRSALILLAAGIAISAMLAGILFLLATGRRRALIMVGQKTDELRHQALHDSLTGLPNRALIMDRIDQLLARGRRNGTVGAALYVDLDGFKNVNDSLGHSVGDRLLQAVAVRLTSGLRHADTIGRLAGDEFVVLIDSANLPYAAALVAERLLELIRQPFEISGVPSPIAMTASVGIASGTQESPEELLREADMALYQAKAAGRNCYETFGPEMGSDIQRRYELEFDLRGAREGGQFRLVYQPIYQLSDLSLVGFEALLRWQHPVLGQIQPDEFIPLLEASGEIVEVGRWVLDRACAQLAEWRDRGSELTVAVNVSGRQLDRDSIVGHVRDALNSSGLDPAALTIEVTETALMRNVDSTASRLRDLKALGVQVAIDDFGTGYSSLAYLQRLPVDCLKIDRSFTDTITQSPESDAIIHTLIQLGRDLGLKTLAEGVEHPRQIDHLRAENVDEVQGFLLARPLTPAALEAQLLVPGPLTPVTDGS